MYRSGQIPEELGKTIIVPIFKNKGDSSRCENYRGVALLNHIAKIYERILERRARNIIEEQLGEEQYGYRKGRSVIDPIFALRTVIEKSWEFNVPLYGVFIDLQKAFDSIPRNKLWACLQNDFGVDGRLLKLLKPLKACMNPASVILEQDITTKSGLTSKQE